MGTISDKLMRIINTKEDIRQALISKGYDVPTSIPFKEYAKMILDLPCNADSFPDIEGIVARYSASGLTNEQMAANPVWVDKTGNEHDLQMKNFAWGGMSGVGGYADNWNSSADWAINSYWVNSHTDHKLQFIKASSVVRARPNNIYNAENVYKNILNVNGLTEAVNKGSVKALRINAVDPITSKAIKTFSFDTDGVIQISFDDVLQDYYIAYFLSGNNTNDIDITIEQLPLYPGALVFDGVDDYGTCNNFPILTKEKGYTVVVLRQWDQDFLNTTLTGGLLSTRNYSTGEGVAFEKIESSNKGYWNLGAGGIIDFAKSPFTWQTSKQYNNVGILKGDKNHGKPLCVGCGLSGGQQCGRFAIWELVFLDHDATEEELTKIKDYFVKTYPWLFPDQAWTVTGKTNEDEDRATIANITGNGNDLVLSNFGFIEGSGYNKEGEYAGYLVTDGVDDKINSSNFDLGKDWTIVGDWTMLSNIPSNCGIIKPPSLFLYNSIDSVTIYINNGGRPIKIQSKSINAICSDGRIYLNDWTEISKPGVQTELGSKANLNITSYGTTFTKMAFKNLAIYDGKILSKDDCIKAYNYLQTLKAK